MAGFNSQRDGILQLPLIAEILGKNGFNSQRDGILQINACFFAFYKDVSIPNGMEFYLDARPFLTNCLWFQFPTGWNSTLKPVWEQSPHYKNKYRKCITVERYAPKYEI